MMFWAASKKEQVPPTKSRVKVRRIKNVFADFSAATDTCFEVLWGCTNIVAVLRMKIYPNMIPMIAQRRALSGRLAINCGLYSLNEKTVRQKGRIIAIAVPATPEFGKNFCKTMMNLTATKPQLKVVFDQVGTPTYALDLAEAIKTIIEDYSRTGSPYGRTGIYHYSNEGVCSWFDFAKMIAEFNGTTACDVQPCHSNEFPSPVTRPSYSVLDKTKIKETFGISIPYWTDSLKKCIENLK